MRLNVPDGVYHYVHSQPNTDGWVMMYTNDDAMSIYLLVDHNPECEKRRMDPLNATKCWSS